MIGTKKIKDIQDGEQFLWDGYKLQISKNKEHQPTDSENIGCVSLSGTSFVYLPPLKEVEMIDQDKQKKIFIDMDDTICDYSGAYSLALANRPEIKYPQSQYGFFDNLKPIDGAISVVNGLIDEPSFEVYILTAPSYKNPLCYTEKRVWIEKHFGLELCKNLIICEDKSLITGDYLIDDKLEGRGRDRFSGELIHFGGDRFGNWGDVAEYFWGCGLSSVSSLNNNEGNN